MTGRISIEEMLHDFRIAGALITPFRNDDVDYDALRALVHWHVEQGTHGLVPVGTTGESATLSEEEHRACR